MIIQCNWSIHLYPVYLSLTAIRALADKKNIEQMKIYNLEIAILILNLPKSRG